MAYPARRKLGLLLAGMAGMLTMVGSADAAVVITNVALDSPGGVNGTITYTPTNPDYVVNAGIGRLKLTTNTGETLLSYCIDIFHSLTTGSFSAASAATSLSATKLAQISAVISNGEALVTSADRSAAEQMAIWEIVNEGSGTFNLSSGDLLISNTSTNAVSLANTYLSNVKNGTWAANPALSLAVLTGTNNQTQLVWGTTANRVLGAVPEPATWAMMLVGFGAIGATLRSRRPARNALALGR